jgi:hypothetical protein
MYSKSHKKPAATGSKTKVAMILLGLIALFMFFHLGPSLTSLRVYSSTPSLRVDSSPKLISPLQSIPAIVGAQPQGHPQTIGLEKKLDEFFGGRRDDGFFIESGAFDGITHSNTLWLERDRNWKGLLVEGNPHMAEKVHKSGRSRSRLVDGCLSIERAVTVVSFQLAGGLGGITSEMSTKQKTRIKKEIGQDAPWMNEDNVGSIVKVKCYPLNDLLNAMNIKVVDFWSVDTEGSEVSILKTVDFDSVMFGVLFIESNSAEHRKKVVDFMKSVGFVENKKLSGVQDSAWHNPVYCLKYNCVLS